MKTLRTFGSPLALAAALALAAPLWVGHVAASGLSADRTILIDANTRWVNVTGGETIHFVGAGQSFEYRFNPFTHSVVYDLGQIAPAGSLNRSVKVYVSPDPAFTG